MTALAAVDGSTWLFASGAAVVLALGGWSLARARTEYRTEGRLSNATATIVWGLYTLHLALTVWAAHASWWRMPIPASVARVLGGIAVLGGTYLYVAGLVAFRSFARMSGLDASELVTGGIYRWSRNPQNVGWGLFLAGIALASRSGVAVLLVVLFGLMFRMYVPVEEEFLSGVFGGAYASYRARTARYLGLPGGETLTE